MTDLTIGQRIARCRKQRNLSQEALGEKMGVSRQAISKWEADAAIPEIDKLIALSRLFGVSVGWLLGVEEAPGVREQSDISEELLQKIDTVVRRYTPKRKPLSTGKKVLLGICAGILALSLWTTFREWDITRREVSYVSAQVRNNNEQNASILNRLENLENQLLEQSVSPSGFSIAQYSFSFEPHEEDPTAVLSFSAVPAAWNGEYKASLSVRYEGKETVTQACAWDGVALRAQVALEPANGYEYWLVTEYPDGSQESLALTDETAEALRSSFEIIIDTEQGTGHFNMVEGTLTLKEYVTHVSRPYLLETCSNFVAWEKVEYRLYHHPASPGPRILIDTFVLHSRTKDATEYSIDGSRSQIHEMAFPGEISFSLPEIKGSDSLELIVYVEMSNGMSTWSTVDSWAYDGDGIFRSVWGGE